MDSNRAPASLPTEPIGSIPRPQELREAIARSQSGKSAAGELDRLFDAAVRDTLRRFEETGSPVVTDGEQRKPSFATYPVHGSKNLAPNGVVIPFADGHTRQLPALAAGPFRFAAYAVDDLRRAKPLTMRRMKQAVISASALSLLYPQAGLAGYPREQFLDDLVAECVKDVRQCLDEGVSVQIDFTEGRLSMRLDPSKGLLRSFVALDNRVLAAFSAAERERIGVHTCPGGDLDSTHSADVDYASFLPELFQLDAGSFFVQLSSEKDRIAALKAMRPFATGRRRIFVGVTDPISRRIETPQEVCYRILEAARFVPPPHLGTTDDCGFSPFADDASTSRDTAFAKIRARVEGTRLAAERLQVA